MKSREGVLLGLVTILASEPLTRATPSGVVGDSNGDRSEIQMHNWISYAEHCKHMFFVLNIQFTLQGFMLTRSAGFSDT